MKTTKLSPPVVLELARMVAKDIRIRHFDEELVRKNMISRSCFMPTLLSDGDVQLWIDRLYVAYSKAMEPNVHYVYISEEHALEELPELPELINRSKSKVEIAFLQDIVRQLNYALQDGQSCYIEEVYKQRLAERDPFCRKI